MKRKLCIFLAVMLAATVFAGCGDKEESASSGSSSIVEHISPDDMPRPAASVKEPEPVAEPEPEPAKGKEVPEGMYLSELTGEPIAEELRNQRPIAVMVDNESIALPHFGTAEADVVYEMMNSTANDRITRLMVMVKDWGAIEQMGSIRSTRPTNILLAAEWNAVLCHDGGPYHNDVYFQKPWTDHFSGTFGRVNNGKSREFTEYILTGDLDRNFSNSRYTREYNDYYTLGDKPHFNFAEWGLEVKLSDVYDGVSSATNISLPFKHNKSQLKYNSGTGTYDYYEYGEVHKDGEDGETLTFKNVLLQCCDFNQLDANGYMIYNCIAMVQPGYYITNGEAKLIYWSKSSECEPTKFYDENNEEIEINTGKTYIGLVPSDTWGQVTLN